MGSDDSTLVGMTTPPTPPVCPFCDARKAERIGQWGGQMITSQWRCPACGSYFEAVRDDFDEEREGERR